MQPAGSSTGRPERGDRLDRPRFRQDLLAELVDEQGARFIDVMDPDSGNLFRFYEVEYSLACAMDGERDVPGIVKWAQDELGLTPSPQEVRNVIATLGDLGFIDPGAPAEAADLAPGVVVGNQPRAAVANQVDLGGAHRDVGPGGRRRRCRCRRPRAMAMSPSIWPTTSPWVAPRSRRRCARRR